MTSDAVRIAEEVLRADGNPFATLSLAPGLAPISASTDVRDARQNYMKIATIIHPDKLKGAYPRATDAFQCLVRAFECFADPVKRRRAAAAASTSNKTAKVKRSREKAAVTKKDKKELATTKQKKRPAKKRRKLDDDSDAEDESSSSSASLSSSVSDNDSDVDEEEEDGDWDAFLLADQPPVVSTSRKPIGTPRTGPNYQETLIGCPQCGTKWEPDSKPQYSLFMGKWGRKAHCQLCLCQFGSATARHSCPYCEAPFHYDASMYDSLYQCKGKCKKSFGFPYFPVNQSLIDQIALDEWKMQKEREKAAERDRRASGRRGRGSHEDSAENQLSVAIATCVMDHECPLCGKKVKSKHRSHVEECMKKKG